MEQALNIRQIGGLTSSPHVSTRSVELALRVNVPWVKPDGDGWEVLEASHVVSETTTTEACKGRMRIRGPRKQRAAKQAVPINVIRVEKPKEMVTFPEAMYVLYHEDEPKPKEVKSKVPVPVKVVGKSANDVTVASLEAQIQKLQKLLGVTK